MPFLVPAAVKTECLRLRQQERRSLTEIAARTGVSMATLSALLRPFPLTAAERAARAAAPRGPSPRKKDRGPVTPAYDGSRSSPKAVAAQARAAVLARLAQAGLPTEEGPDGLSVVDPTTRRRRRLIIKTARRQQAAGLPVVSLLTNFTGGRRRYAPGEFDILVGYDAVTDIAYVYLERELAHLKNSVTIRPDAAENWAKLGGG